MKHSPGIIFTVLALVVTGAAAWVVKAFVDIGRAVQLPRKGTIA